MKFNIRQANIEDKEAILKLVRKLACYERKKPEEVKVTIEKIELHGFSKDKYFDVLLADHNGVSIAYALYFFSYSASAAAPILYVEDIFVETDYRNQGLGRAIFSALAHIAMEKKCCRLEWHAFTWNESAVQFYQKLGAIPKPDLLQFRFLCNDLNAQSNAIDP